MNEEHAEEVQHNSGWKADLAVGALIAFDLVVGGYIAVVERDPIATFLVGSVVLVVAVLLLSKALRGQVMTSA